MNVLGWGGVQCTLFMFLLCLCSVYSQMSTGWLTEEQAFYSPPGVFEDENGFRGMFVFALSCSSFCFVFTRVYCFVYTTVLPVGLGFYPQSSLPVACLEETFNSFLFVAQSLVDLNQVNSFTAEYVLQEAPSDVRLSSLYIPYFVLGGLGFQGECALQGGLALEALQGGLGVNTTYPWSISFQNEISAVNPRTELARTMTEGVMVMIPPETGWVLVQNRE